jgi:hypothetical protein
VYFFRPPTCRKYPRTAAEFQKIINSTPGLKKLKHIFEMDADVFEKRFLNELNNLDATNPKTMIGDMINAATGDAAIFGKGAFSNCGGCVPPGASRLGVTKMSKSITKGSTIHGFLVEAQGMTSNRLKASVNKLAAASKMSYADRKLFMRRLKKDEYVKYFEPTFIGVTGQPEKIKALTLQMSVVYMPLAEESATNDEYTVDHSSSILVINPEGKLHAFLQPPHNVTSILDSVRTIVD